MITSYQFTIAQLNSTQLTTQITASSIVTALAHIDTEGSNVSVYFKDALSEVDEATLTALISAYVYVADPVETPVQQDSDGATFSRTKQAPTGWTFQLRSFELKTSTLDSIFNKNPSGTSLTDITIKLYDINGTLITDQGVADTDCVRTVVDWEPTYDYYVIGGQAKILVTPTNDVRISVVAVPDVPANYGGSKVMIQNVNFKYIGSHDKVDADGRASKALIYSAVNHTNKIRFIFTHLAGEKHDFMIIIEQYKL